MNTQTETQTKTNVFETIAKETINDMNNFKIEEPSTSIIKPIIDEDGTVNLLAIKEEDKPKYHALTKSINLNDINSISSYGSELNGAMSSYSKEYLNAVRANSCGEIGTLVNNLLTELGYVDVKDFENQNAFKRFISKLPLLGHLVKNIDKMMVKYDTISNNVDKIATKILATRLNALKDNNALQLMFDANIQYMKQVDDLIIAGTIKLEEIKQKVDLMMKNPAEYPSYVLSDATTFQQSLEKKIHDLRMLRFVIKQSLPQIRIVQNNNLTIADKAQSIISTTIPVWRNQLSIAVALYNQKNNILAQRKVSDTTNEILKKNALLLKQNSIDTAKENERSVIDVETLKKTTQELINTFQEVKRIHEEGKQKRDEASRELENLENELEATMISLKN